MMMQIQLSPRIRRDLLEIGEYIAKHNPTRALSFIEELEAAIAEIGKSPFIYRLRPDVGAGARVSVYGRYVILFRVDGETVFIERVVSGARSLANLPRQ